MRPSSFHIRLRFEEAIQAILKPLFVFALFEDAEKRAVLCQAAEAQRQTKKLVTVKLSPERKRVRLLGL